MSRCDHLDYCNYFDQCLDCSLTGEEIHTQECGGFPDGYEVLEDGMVRCNRCEVDLPMSAVDRVDL